LPFFLPARKAQEGQSHLSCTSVQVRELVSCAMLVPAKMSDTRQTRAPHPPPKGGDAPVRPLGFAPEIPPIWFSNREIQLLEYGKNPCKPRCAPRSNRENSRVAVFAPQYGFPALLAHCAAGTRPAQYRCSPPNLVCYSHRRTRVPPNGSRATAPARPSPEASRLLRWCLRRQPASLLRRGLPPIARGEFCARSYTD